MPARSLENFRRCLANLRTALETPIVDDRDLAGVVKLFELAYETGWKALGSALRLEGHAVPGSKSAFRKAVQLGWLEDSADWGEMVQARNESVHIYQPEAARSLAEDVRTRYVPLLESLLARLAEGDQ